MRRPAMDDDLDLQSDWDTLRIRESGTMPKVTPPAPWKPPAEEVFRAWVEGIDQGRPLLTVNGPSPQDRAKAYKLAVQTEPLVHVAGVNEGDDWVRKDFENAVFRRLAKLHGQPWSWAFDLLSTDLTMENQLREVVDQGVSLLTSAYKLLWEIKFRVQEDKLSLIHI